MKTLNQIIPGLMAFTGAAQTTVKLPSESWNAKWIKLQTAHHPKLKEMEREIGRFCFEMWASPMKGRQLVLAGENGTGKTHCAEAVKCWVERVGHGKQFVKQVNHISHLECVFWNWSELLDALKSGEWDSVDGAVEATLLIIDELGGGYDPSRIGTDKLCQILSRRENSWTLITTNIKPDSWEEQFDRRVASRLFRNSMLIDLSGVSDFSTL